MAKNNRAAVLLLWLGLVLLCLPVLAQEEEEEEEFKGVGIHLKLRGAWVAFEGGDIDKGTSGMYDRQVAEIAALGFELGTNSKKPFRRGYEITGDVVYYFTPKLGIGAGGSLVRGHQESSLLFNWPGSPYDYRMMGLPDIKITSLRLGLYYVIPVSRLLAFCVSAGPEYHFAKYKYGGNTTTTFYAYSLEHEAKAQQLGLFGGFGLEIRMNRRLAFIIEGLVRYAKISGFEGDEEEYRWMANQSTTVVEKGTIDYIEGIEFPRLDIPSEGVPVPQGAREAVFDFSGASVQAGLNFKF